jgi:hypothetical protein
MSASSCDGWYIPAAELAAGPGKTLKVQNTGIGSNGGDGMRRQQARTWTIAACAAAASLLLAGTAGAFSFRDEVGRFADEFPAEPTLDKHEGQSASGPHVHYTWEVDVDDRHFSVTYTEYRTAPVKNYDKNVMGLLAATKGKLVHQARIEQDGVDGREVVTLLPDNAVMRQRLFQVGNRLYQAVYAGPFGTEAKADVEAFMSSFQILK